MALFRNAIGAALGMRRIDETIERVLNEVTQRQSEGLVECTVAVQQLDVGARRTLDSVYPMIVDALQAAGHAVVSVDGLDGWSQTLSIHIRPGERRPSARYESEGKLGSTMTTAQLMQEAQQLRRWLAHSENARAWARRLELGFGIANEGMPQADWFWLNAAPSLAHLRTQDAPDPLVRVFAAMAESCCDQGDSEQVAAVREIGSSLGPGW